MTATTRPTGIVGGSGMLGSAIAQALLDRKAVNPADFWVSNRQGGRRGLEQFPEVNVTTDNARLCAACEIIILAVPPSSLPELSIHVPDRLVISVMAGVTLDDLRAATGADRIVRAMSSPAAAIGLAYTPWFASASVDASDRAAVWALFEACGATDEIEDESHLDHFTAMTGPVPGFVAFYAECMIDYAVNAGISPAIAERAIRQLFFSAGAMLAHGAASPSDHVKQMVDYAGTTAAGLTAMRQSSIRSDIANGLDAAVLKARNLR